MLINRKENKLTVSRKKAKMLMANLKSQYPTVALCYIFFWLGGLQYIYFTTKLLILYTFPGIH